MELIFSYGSLQNENVQMKLFGRIFNGNKDVLKHYQIMVIEIEDQAFISKGEGKFQKTLTFSNNPDDLIEGTVLEVHEEELLLADRHEPDNYRRIKVELHSGKQAWVYTAT
jgi:gamma-glutamylcyclotransferase (GGCT)/AIG2-like uncharacterized protein YtfP